MKAILLTHYGSPDVLKLEEIDKPAVSDDGVLVRIHASSVNTVDLFSLTRTAYMARMLTSLLKPKREILGTDFTGIVEAVGKSVTQFQVGDEVFGGSQKVVLFLAKMSKAALLVLQDLLETGRVTPVIDRRYELSEAPEALRYLGEGHAKGKIVITL